MYELYYLSGACSLATQVVLRELNQEVKIIDKTKVDNFNSINPVGSVPVLIDGNKVLTEGAAIMLHLLKKHNSSLMPKSDDGYQKALQEIMFANATVHPAYSKLFFIAQHITDESAKRDAFNEAANSISQLWKVVENKLDNKPFLGGDTISTADIMLTVYSRWGAFFPVDITFGEQTRKMFAAVEAMPSFKKSVEAESITSAE